MIVVREVNIEDREKITELAREFVESLKEPFYESIWLGLLESYFIGLEIEELEYRNLNIFCAEDTNKKELIGMLVAEVEFDRLRRSYGDISLWYVREKYRGKKIGYQLAMKALDYFKKNKVSYIETNIREDTPKAQELSEKFGFKTLYTRTRLYL